MRNHEDVKRNEQDRPEQDSYKEVKIANAYVAFKESFIEILSNFELIVDGHSGRINTATNRNELFSVEAKANHSAPNRASPKAHKLQRNEIDQILSKEAL